MLTDRGRTGRADPLPVRPAVARPGPALPEGFLEARTLAGCASAPPDEGCELIVGRDPGEGHVPFGVDDRMVSRQHIALRRAARRWWLHNVGRRSVRLQSGTVLPGGEPIPLALGWTAAFVDGSRGRAHLLDLHVSAGEPARAVRADTETVQPRVWPLKPDEHRAMVVLGQRYLRYEAHPQPLAWQEAFEELHEIDPETGWTSKRLQHTVKRIRMRLSAAGVPGLVAEEVDGPLGNQLNHNLIRELVESTTLVASDLAAIDG